MIRSRLLTYTWLVVITLTVTDTAASNVGFWLKLGVVSDGSTAGLYWIALPYTYTPPDANTNLLVDAEDLVQDLQPTGLPSPCTEAASDCAVVHVEKWDETVGDYVSWTGGASGGSPFELVPGVAYALELQAVTGQTDHIVNVVGAHDPSFEFSDCYDAGAVNMRWVSLPPHLAVDTSFGDPDILDAEDLGQAMGGPDAIFQIRRLNESTGLFENWVVGSAYGTPFEIDLSRGYAIDLSCSDLAGTCGQCPWLWTPPHF